MPSESGQQPAADAAPAPRLRADDPQPATANIPAPLPVREVAGPKGPEPTRFGDWERAGRCIDF